MVEEEKEEEEKEEEEKGERQVCIPLSVAAVHLAVCSIKMVWSPSSSSSEDVSLYNVGRPLASELPCFPQATRHVCLMNRINIIMIDRGIQHTSIPLVVISLKSAFRPQLVA